MSDIESIEVASSSVHAESRPDREGLPPGYRMRADAHYVDHLMSRRQERTERATVDVRRTAESVDRDGAGDPRGRRADRVLAHLAEDLASIQSAAAILAADTSAAARRVSVDLIRAHAGRAAWLVRAHALLDGQHRGHMKMRAIGPLLQEVAERLAPEARLAGSSLRVEVPDWHATVEVDAAALAAGVAGAVYATLGLAEADERLAIVISAAAEGSQLRSVEIRQDAVRVGPARDGRFLDPSWSDRPGNWTATLGATVAKTVAQLAGGEAVFLASDAPGSTVRFTFRPAR